MKDMKGNEINVGDTVVTSHAGNGRGRYAGLEIGTVVKLTPKGFRFLGVNKKPTSWSDGSRIVYSYNCLILKSVKEE